MPLDPGGSSRRRKALAGADMAALNSRVTIEQAKGMLAEYLSMTMDDAFKLLRNYARDHNRRLSKIASDLVDRKIPALGHYQPCSPGKCRIAACHITLRR
jgi:hypothetical protein